MNNVVLHGDLLEQFGVLPPMAIRDPAEAVRALTSQLKGFADAIRGSDWFIVVEDKAGKFALTADEMTLGLDGGSIHFVPSVEGAAGSGGGKGGAKLIIGVALIGASLLIPGMQGFGLAAAKTAWASSVGVGGITFGHMALAGVALALAGSAMMIAPQPTQPSADSAPDTNSFIFNGNQDPSGQGMAVPLVFGIFRAVPIPVATRIETDQIGINGGQGGASAYTNYPVGYNPNSGITPEQYASQRALDSFFG